MTTTPEPKLYTVKVSEGLGAAPYIEALRKMDTYTDDIIEEVEQRGTFTVSFSMLLDIVTDMEVPTFNGGMSDYADLLQLVVDHVVEHDPENASPINKYRLPTFDKYVSIGKESYKADAHRTLMRVLRKAESEEWCDSVEEWLATHDECWFTLRTMLAATVIFNHEGYNMQHSKRLAENLAYAYEDVLEAMR